MKFIWCSMFLSFIAGAYATESTVCESYDKFEKQEKCGSDGYLIYYGKRNCLNFNKEETKDLFDANGKEFIDCTTDCLIDFMDNLIKQQPNISCYGIEEEAFKSHVSCYISCDFCKVCKTNKKALFNTYSFKDFFSTESIAQVYAIIASCGLFTCFYS